MSQTTVRLVVGDAAAARGCMGHACAAAAAGAAPPPRLPPPPPHVTLTLTPQECAIFSVLREVGAGTGTAVRVAGGWVRDKLVGRDSHDIDVSVDNMSGVEFAAHVNAFLAARGDATSSVGVIQANPDQSKHLETATARVLGAWVDFVGLRAEVYEGDSRIPRVQAGTPVQDAMRRDFTLNAMFYNISEGCVEDLTGLGFGDLASGTLRTPLPPLLTLRDDPLRVLRAVRFSARFGLALAEDLAAAARAPAVAADLLAKVSRERVGIEVDKMLGEGAAPPAALQALHCLGLAATVFASPASAEAQLGGCLRLPPGAADAAGALPAPLRAAAASPDALAAAPPCQGLAALPPQWLEVGMQVVEALVWAAGALGGSGAAALVERRGGSASASASASGGASGGGAAPAGMEEEGGAGAGSGAPPPPQALPPPFSFTPPRHLPSPEAAARLGALAGLRPALPCAATAALDAALGSAEERRLLYYAAVLFPLAPAWRGNARNSKTEPLAGVLLLEGLKRKRKDSEDVGALQRGALGFLELLGSSEFMGELAGAPAPPPHASPARAAAALALGNLLRRDAKELWRAALLLALAVSVHPHLQAAAAAAGAAAGAGGGGGGGGVGAGAGAGAAPPLPPPQAHAIAALMAAHNAIAARVVGAWALEGCWAWRPKLDGRELKSEVDASIAGPAVGAVMERQLTWQLLNPHGSREECVAFLRGAKG